MKAWEIVAWTFDGAAFCTEHPPQDVGGVTIPDQTETEEGKVPVFASDEGWDDLVCDTCFTPIPETL